MHFVLSHSSFCSYIRKYSWNFQVFFTMICYSCFLFASLLCLNFVCTLHRFVSFRFGKSSKMFLLRLRTRSFMLFFHYLQKRIAKLKYLRQVCVRRGVCVCVGECMCVCVCCLLICCQHTPSNAPPTSKAVSRK